MKKTFILILIVLAGLVQFACKKNGVSGPPTITNVRSVDTTKRDSTFLQAVPGTLVVIQGSNLDGAQAVFFNDTAASFNPVYNTSTSLIVTIPSSAQTAATNPNVPSVIKVVTDHGTAIFSFKLYLPPPVIYSIAFDNSGKLVYITGANFQGIKKVQFPTINKDSALSYIVNKTFTQITAAIPPGVALQDSLRVLCTFGTAAFSYPPPMVITSVSNENGTAGTTIIINGTNFVGINNVVFPGLKIGTNVQVLSVNQLSVTVPAGITTTDFLTVQGVLGSAISPQLFDSYITHTSPGYLSTFDVQYATDNTGFIGWTGGYASNPTYPGATGAIALLQQSSPIAANSNAGSQGNAGLLQLNDVPWIANKATSITGYSMKFEMYVANPWTAGQVWVSVGDWYTWTSYAARYSPWEAAPNGSFQPTGWVTVTIPLTQFITGNTFSSTTWNPAGSPAKTFADYPTTGVGFMIMNDQPKAVPANIINLGIDNVRIVKGQ